jgi:hypothetical protein
MITADYTDETARSWALDLVCAMQVPRMEAYAQVAAMIGASAGRLRKFIGRQPNASIRPHEYLNLALAYRSLCERIEASAEEQRRRAAQAREKANAALTCSLVVVDGLPGARQSRAGGEA